MTASDLHGLTGVYALDALDADEAKAFEAHLETCAPCRQEVRELHEVAAALSLTTLAVPPPDLKGRLFATILDLRPARHRIG